MCLEEPWHAPTDLLLKLRMVKYGALIFAIIQSSTVYIMIYFSNGIYWVSVLTSCILDKIDHVLTRLDLIYLSIYYKCHCLQLKSVNSLWANAAEWHLRTGLALVQVMACPMVAAKPLPEPLLIYCQLDREEHISVKFESKYKTFCQENAVCQPFCMSLSVL